MAGCTGATLAVGQSCTLGYAFAPLALGDRAASVAAFAQDADFVDSADLFGTGLPVPVPAPAPAAPPAPPTPAPATPAPVAPSPKPIASTAASAATVTRTTRHLLLIRGLRFTQSFPAAGRVHWTLALPGRRIVVASATRTLRSAGMVRVTLRLSRAGRVAFSHGRGTRLVLRTSFTPTGRSQPSVTSTAVRLAA